MIERLRKIKEKYEELTKDLVNPDILADMSVWQKKSKDDVFRQKANLYFNISYIKWEGLLTST